MINREEMKTINVDAIIKENKILMQQIKENREKFWKKNETVVLAKNK